MDMRKIKFSRLSCIKNFYVIPSYSSSFYILTNVIL